MRKRWERHFLPLEALTVAAAASAFIVWCELGPGIDHMDRWLAGDRTVIYATIASVAGVLLGFTITAVSILITIVDSPKFRVVREAGHVDQLWAIFFQAIWAFGAATVLAILGLLFDRENDPNRLVMYANVAAFGFASARAVREIWVLDAAVTILVPERKRPTKTPFNP
ncbi:MAG TPA: hypothetical protein VMW65_08090 [Chloroflexota bacterium]|nr:hypothetical protein [Chloroflexota bacterium]